MGLPRGGAPWGRGWLGGGARLRRRHLSPSCLQPPGSGRALSSCGDLFTWCSKVGGTSSGPFLSGVVCVYVKSFLSCTNRRSLKLLKFRAGATRFARRKSILKLFCLCPFLPVSPVSAGLCGGLIWGVCAGVISSSCFTSPVLCMDASSGVGLECVRTCVGVGCVSSDVCLRGNS